jgi:hypothetical protein
MKQVLFIFLFSLALFNCTENSSSDGIEKTDIIALSEARVSNFILVLPEILDFSKQYYASLSPSQQEDPEANEKFFKALKKSARVQSMALKNNFSSIDELILVYKNVALEYASIQQDFTSFKADIQNIKKQIDSYESNYLAILANKNTTSLQAKETERQLKELENDKKRYQNLILIEKFKSAIDQIYLSLQK